MPPNDFVIKTALPRVDYSDTFSGEYRSDLDNNIEAIAQLFLNSSPQWARKFLYIRNKLVGWTGLITRDIPLSQEYKIKLAIGQRIGLFNLYDFTNDEVLFGEDDKHLDVRMILKKTSQRVSITTLVQFKNTWRKIYFTTIRIFHQQIMKSQLRKLIMQLNAAA